MMKIQNYICAGMVALMAAACEENAMGDYENDPAIYFYNATNVQKDSIAHTFFYYDEDIKQDTVRVRLSVMGMPTDYDRLVKLEQTNVGEPDAAIPGTHYIPFDDPKLADAICIPAGKVTADVPVVLLRDASLMAGAVRLKFTVVANEYFRPGIDAWRNFLITTTDNVTKPVLWDTRWRYYFGASWGPVKMKFIIDYTGYTDFDTLPSDYSYINWMGATAKQALLEYNRNHPDNPLCEADGKLVTFDS